MLSTAALAFSTPASAVPTSLLALVESFPHPTTARTVSATVLSLARAATEVHLHRWKMLAAMTMIGTALSIGAGGSFLASTIAQDPVPSNALSKGTTFNSVANLPADENPMNVRLAYSGPNLPPAHIPQWDYHVVALTSDPVRSNN